MDFNQTTKRNLTRILDELEYLASDYDWGSNEYNFLMEIAATIEDEVRK